MANIFKPILFSTEMVQAILAGRKTQTRRVFDREPKANEEDYEMIEMSNNGKIYFAMCLKQNIDGFPFHGFFYPKYQLGDILWVRESGIIYKIEGTTGFHLSDEKPIGFKSIQKIGIEYIDGDRIELNYPERLSLNIKCGDKLSNGVFKEGARIFLKVTNVRCERLQDISEDDAITEGIEPGEIGFKSYNPKNIFEVDAHWSFRNLWDSINAKKHPWESNPWVWVYDFEQIEKPENFLT